MTGKKILVADDTQEVVNVVEEVLTNAGFTVYKASDGEEALSRVWEVKPDLILLDVMMPKKNGYEVLDILKEQPDTQGIPVIMLTARTGELDKKISYASGADDYIEKPFSVAELLKKVNLFFE